MLQLARYRTTPVLTKGSSYNGVQADALAAPGAAWNGSQFSMTCSMWNIATSKWSSIFFTSSDLETWSYVNNSRRTPGTYLLGNAGLAWFDSKWYFVYQEEAAIKVDTSTDLVNWTAITTVAATGFADCAPVVNPNNGKLEIWSLKIPARQINLHDSADGSSWTDRGVQYTNPNWSGETEGFGEGHAYYYGTARYLVFDFINTGIGPDNRMRGLAVSLNRDTTYTSYGSILGPAVLNSWESVQVFDGACVGAFDRSDGRGTKLWTLYAGGDNTSLGDATSSSIGLAYMDTP